MNSPQHYWNAEAVQPQTPKDHDCEPENSSPSNDGSLLKRLESIASLSQIIRIFGACAIIASMSLFMLQGWAEGNDITRYLKLLAQTGLLTGAGLVLSFLIKEFKGARVFFGLALVSVVANFTILGSLTYSIFPMDVQIVDYPEAMKWEVIQSALFLPVFLGAIALLSAVAYFAFSIFSRQIAKPLSLGFLGLSAVLLVPVRAPLVAVGLAGLTLWAAWRLIQRLRKADTVVMTRETKASLAVLLLPGLIILARAVSFYNIDEFTLLAFSGLLFFAIRNAGGLINPEGVPKLVSEVLQFALGAFIAFMTTQVLPTSWNDVDLLIASAIFTYFSFDQLRLSRSQVWRILSTNIAASTIVAIALLSAIFGDGIVHSAQALTACGLTFFLTLKASNIFAKTIAGHVIATLGMVVSSLVVLFDLVQLAQLGNWMVIGLCGAILIIGASLYERFGIKLRPSTAA